MLLGIVASADIHDDPNVGGVIGTRGVAVGRMTQTDGVARMEVPAIRREAWSFAHEGEIEDIGRIRARISARRALEMGTDSVGENLFAFVLTCIDAHDDGVDAGLLRATSDIANAGARGIFDFIISGNASLYAYRSSRPMALLLRPRAVMVATEAFTSESWRALASGSLVRIEHEPSLSWRFVTGSFERDVSGPELPFTD